MERAPFDLGGRVALVTGSSKGIGKATAMALGSIGARVALNYHRNEEAAEETLREYLVKGYRGNIFKGDVTDPVHIATVVREIEEKLGSIEILVLNATPEQPHLPIEDTDWSLYQVMIDYFVKSPFLLTREVLANMKRKGWGRIITLGTEDFHRGAPNFSAYVTAKGGQNGWMRSMAVELAPSGITVNMVSPGWIPVERHRNEPDATKKAYLESIPMRRWGKPEDIGWVIAFLVSEEANFITGQDICIDGGLNIG